MKLTLEQCQELMDEHNGNLVLQGRKDITELPDGLTVNGHLDIFGSAITKLPKNLTVKDSLFMRETAITEIPDDCHIGGSIYARNSQLSKLPNNLTIKGVLQAENTQIREVPMGLIVTDRIICSGNSPLVNLAFEGYKIEIKDK